MIHGFRLLLVIVASLSAAPAQVGSEPRDSVRSRKDAQRQHASARTGMVSRSAEPGSRRSNPGGFHAQVPRAARSLMRKSPSIAPTAMRPPRPLPFRAFSARPTSALAATAVIQEERGGRGVQKAPTREAAPRPVRAQEPTANRPQPAKPTNTEREVRKASPGREVRPRQTVPDRPMSRTPIERVPGPAPQPHKEPAPGVSPTRPRPSTGPTPPPRLHQPDPGHDADGLTIVRGDSGWAASVRDGDRHLTLGSRDDDFARRWYGSPSRHHVYPYHVGPYRRCFSPIYWPTNYSTVPWYGYTFASVYVQEPYVRYAYTDPVYYADNTSVLYADGISTVIYGSETAGSPVDAYSNGVAPGATPGNEAASSGAATSSGDSGWGPVVGPGVVAFQAGRYDEARRAFSRAMIEDDRNGYAAMLYAWTDFALGEFELAANSIRRGLSATPELIDFPIDVRTLYSDVLALEGQLARLRDQVLDRPEDTNARLVYAYLLYSLGEATEAARLLEPRGDALPDDVTILLLRDAAVRAAGSKIER